MKKRILSASLTLLLLMILALNTVLPAYAVTAAEFEAVHQWNLSIFNAKSTDEEALKSFTEPVPTIPCDNPEIIELAASITKSKNSEYSKARAIHDWVSANVWYDFDLVDDIADGGSYYLYNAEDDSTAAMDALETKRGVCGHYAYLTVSLLRATGIPATVAEGYADSGYSVSLEKYHGFIAASDSYANHLWSEAYIGGRWVIIDSTWDSGNTYQNGKFSPKRSVSSDYFDVSVRTFSKNHFYMMAYDVFVKDVEIPSDADVVVPFAFFECAKLENVLLPDKLTEIGSWAFYGCAKLENVLFPESLVRVGDNSFRECTSLLRAAFPGNVESIGESAFYSCEALADIVFPESLAVIERLAFSSCKSLTEVIIPAGVGRIETGVFMDCSGLRRIMFNEGLETIGEHAFSYCGDLKTIRLPDSMICIEPYAFYYCGSLNSVIIPGGVETLGAGAFSGCHSLGVAYLPDGLKKIESEAFRDCVSLQSVVIPSSVKAIARNAFTGCPGLTIYGEAGSYAEAYAGVNRIDFIAGTPLDTSAVWARDGIADAIGKGFVRGELQNNYSNVITRAEFCRMAIAWVEFAAGKDIDAILSERGLQRDTDAFTDTNDADILAAFALGITNGTGDNKFSPDSEFSREQAAAMIANTCKAVGADAADPPPSGFTDLETAAEWALSGINFVRAHGIMQGTGDDRFSPKTVFTREQSIVTFNNIDYYELAG